MVKDVRCQVAGFPANRGTMPMSAWLFDISEIDAYVGYSALEQSRLWENRVSPEGMVGGRMSADGLSEAGTTHFMVTELERRGLLIR
jgi:hypothetical protein